MHFAMVIYFVSLILSVVSIAVIGVLIGVLAIQQVSGHIKVVKRRLIEAFIAAMLIYITLLIRRVSPLDAMTTILFDKLGHTLSLYAAVVIGYAATVIYVRPKSSNWKDIYKEIVSGRKIFFPFILFISIIGSLIFLSWITPMRVELVSSWPSPLHVTVREVPHLIAYNIGFFAFLLYPVVVFLLASYAAENKTVSRDLRAFAICVLLLGASNYLQAFLVTANFAEAAGIIQIPCFIVITYVFRRITVLQNFYHVELKEYMARLRRRGKQ